MAASIDTQHYQPPSGKVVHGRDGWLFLHRDTNRVMGQQSGEIRLDPNQLTQWRVLLDTRAAWLARQGAAYVFMIAPNAASIFPEMLPAGFASSPHRPVHQLLDHLAQHGSPAQVLYPEAELIALKSEEAPYARNETHWTDPGAFRAYELLLDELEPGVELRRLGRNDLETARAIHHGDLGRQVDPPVEAEHVYTHVRDPRARLLSDNRVFNTGRTLVYECPTAPGSCVMLGDSFAYRMLPFLAESFGRLVFVHRPTQDFELVEAERPAAVVSLLTERFLVRVPFDQPFTPTRVHVRNKREAGEVLAPRDESYLRPDVWPPLNLVEDQIV
jgi:alginate O-acetyltransferase complex protein AlgJ